MPSRPGIGSSILLFMHAKRQRNLELAHAVLDWNQRHLNRHTTLSREQVAECFAEQFVVEPNGRHYAADLESYREFLEGMKQDMQGIRYAIQHATADEDSVVFSMDVCITKTDDSTQHFVAMLLMRFDEHEKVSLWREVYLPHPQAGAQ
ncbi:nuclear transport factor 2 family protein [Comamonas sp. Z3]|nr:nuclear transport factor 2 family protein [Comamonas sp. Z3]